ncbi:hypothetical protein M885DRAFT_235260 [Pelagophyceae sp. CCMP2097]|nr:hypothetical protein M885DRAFT_235260 [Pelagophyceae sp. CCMP2097]
MRAIRTENKRSAASAREKLVFELAKQTHAGLVSALGVHYEMTSIANVIRLAFQTETLGAADVDALPNAVRRAARQRKTRVGASDAPPEAGLDRIVRPTCARRATFSRASGHTISRRSRPCSRWTCPSRVHGGPSAATPCDPTKLPASRPATACPLGCAARVSTIPSWWGQVGQTTNAQSKSSVRPTSPEIRKV